MRLRVQVEGQEGFHVRSSMHGLFPDTSSSSVGLYTAWPPSSETPEAFRQTPKSQKEEGTQHTSSMMDENYDKRLV